MALNGYIQQVQRLMRDENQKLLNPQNLVEYTNRARRQVALQTQCIRVLPPIAGQIQAITVTNPGTGYTNPTVVITSPDSPTGAQLFPQGAQAVATASLNAGTIANIFVNFGGDGYFQPIITITDPTGTGATAVPVISPINITVQGQEIYPFSQIPLANFPGVDGIYNVRSISVLFSNWRYTALRFDFQSYQNYIRRYPTKFEYVPEVCAQYGQGKQGSIYSYPVSNAAYQWEWDCICSPRDLITDDSPEAIPEPWTDAVPFLASYYAMLELANFNGAKFYLDTYDNFTSRYSAGARPGGVKTNPYGRA